MTDTPPEVATLIRERMMALSGTQRLRMGVEMFEAARRMVLASFPPHLSEVERKQTLFERIYPECLPFPRNKDPR